MDHCRILLAHQMSIKQPLHLLGIQVLLVHVLPELVRVRAQHVHGPVVHLLVHVLVDNGR